MQCKSVPRLHDAMQHYPMQQLVLGGRGKVVFGRCCREVAALRARDEAPAAAARAAPAERRPAPGAAGAPPGERRGAPGLHGPPGGNAQMEGRVDSAQQRKCGGVCGGPVGNADARDDAKNMWLSLTRTTFSVIAITASSCLHPRTMQYLSFLAYYVG